MAETVEGRRLKQYEIVVETYRHHLEVYFKLAGLYLAITGGVAGFVFAESVGHAQRRALLSFLMLVSAAAVVANLVVLYWGRSLQKNLDDLARSLGLEQVSLLAARALVVLIIVLVGIVTATSARLIL